MGEALLCGTLWVGKVWLVDARGMPVCVKRKGALPEGEGSVTMWSSLQMSMCHAIEPGSRPGFEAGWGAHALPLLQAYNVIFDNFGLIFRNHILEMCVSYFSCVWLCL